MGALEKELDIDQTTHIVRTVLIYMYNKFHLSIALAINAKQLIITKCPSINIFEAYGYPYALKTYSIKYKWIEWTKVGLIKTYHILLTRMMSKLQVSLV